MPSQNYSTHIESFCLKVRHMKLKISFDDFCKCDVMVMIKLLLKTWNHQKRITKYRLIPLRQDRLNWIFFSLCTFINCIFIPCDLSVRVHACSRSFCRLHLIELITQFHDFVDFSAFFFHCSHSLSLYSLFVWVPASFAALHTSIDTFRVSFSFHFDWLLDLFALIPFLKRFNCASPLFIY